MEPIALFNLADNPKEVEARNLIRNPEYESKVKAMHAHYIRFVVIRIVRQNFSSP